jgi:hypothetical protein
LRIEVDGKTCLRKTLPMAPLVDWNPNYLLAVGNELTTDRRWLGTIEQASVRVEH